MSKPHLQAREKARARGGWRLANVLPGDDYRVSASWDMCRGESCVLIDFDGLQEDGVCLPLEESYGCQVRGRPAALYFRRFRRSRELWGWELADFVRGLDEVGPTERSSEAAADEQDQRSKE